MRIRLHRKCPLREGLAEVSVLKDATLGAFSAAARDCPDMATCAERLYSRAFVLAVKGREEAAFLPLPTPAEDPFADAMPLASFGIEEESQVFLEAKRCGDDTLLAATSEDANTLAWASEAMAAAASVDMRSEGRHTACLGLIMTLQSQLAMALGRPEARQVAEKEATIRAFTSQHEAAMAQQAREASEREAAISRAVSERMAALEARLAALEREDARKPPPIPSAPVTTTWESGFRTEIIGPLCKATAPKAVVVGGSMFTGTFKVQIKRKGIPNGNSLGGLFYAGVVPENILDTDGAVLSQGVNEVALSQSTKKTWLVHDSTLRSGTHHGPLAPLQSGRLFNCGTILTFSYDAAKGTLAVRRDGAEGEVSDTADAVCIYSDIPLGARVRPFVALYNVLCTAVLLQ